MTSLTYRVYESQRYCRNLKDEANVGLEIGVNTALNRAARLEIADFALLVDAKDEAVEAF